MSDRTIQPLKFGNETVYIEVSEVGQEGQAQTDGFENVGAIDRVKNAGTQIESTIRGLSTAVFNALSESQPAEWTLEINLGFNGKAGIPFITEGEARGAVKVTAKWKRDE